jgi:hypothetical protein
LEVIGIDELATSNRHPSRSFGDQAGGTVELARPCDTSIDGTDARRAEQTPVISQVFDQGFWIRTRSALSP